MGNSIGFDMQGYADTSFALPSLFYGLSPDKAALCFGVWKIRIILFDNAAKAERAFREYALTFSDGSGVPAGGCRRFREFLPPGGGAAQMGYHDRAPHDQSHRTRFPELLSRRSLLLAADHVVEDAVVAA